MASFFDLMSNKAKAAVDTGNNFRKQNLGRGQGTPISSVDYRKSLLDKGVAGKETLNSLKEKYNGTVGPTSFTGAINSVKNSYTPAPSRFRNSREEYAAKAGSKALASAETKELEEDKSKYEEAMRNIKSADRIAGNVKKRKQMENISENSMATPGAHLSNLAWINRLSDDDFLTQVNPFNIPEAQDKVNDSLSQKTDEYSDTAIKSSPQIIDSNSQSPEEAAAEAYGQDTTAAVIDPVTGQAIPYSDLTIAGQQLAADDYAGHAAAQYLYGTEGLYDKYGDDWSKFQREGTYDEWKAVLSDPRMAQYFTNITTDKDFLDENGNFDFDKYWQHAITLDAMNTPELSDRDFALIYGDSSGVLNANNMWRRDMMQNSPSMYGLSIDTNAEYPTEYQQYLNSLVQGENAPIYQDENGNMYYNGFGDNGLNSDQLLSLLNMQTMQDAMMTYGTPDAYSLNEANMLANMPGWDTTYSDEAAEGYSNNYGMPENFDLKTYNPYALNPNQLYYMLNGGDQVYDPTGYIMNEYMNTPAGLYYTRNS